MADGDSMPPFADGTYVIGEYIEQLSLTGKEYMFITFEGYTYDFQKNFGNTGVFSKQGGSWPAVGLKYSWNLKNQFLFHFARIILILQTGHRIAI